MKASREDSGHRRPLLASLGGNDSAAASLRLVQAPDSAVKRSMPLKGGASALAGEVKI